MRVIRILVARWLWTRHVALVAIASVTIGVAAMIVVFALMDGVLGFLRDHFRGTEGDLVIRHRSVPHLESDLLGLVAADLESEMVSKGGSIRAFSPRLFAQGLIVPGEKPTPDEQDRIQGAILFGVDFESESEVVPLQRQMEDVALPELRVPAERRTSPFVGTRRPAILLGDALAKRLGVQGPLGPRGGDLVTIVVATPKRGAEGQPTFDQPRSETFEVAGCFTTGREDYDRLRALVARADLRKLRYDQPEFAPNASVVAASLAPGVSAGSFARELRSKKERLVVRTWEEEHRNELRSIEDQKRILVVILFFIVAVATIAILGIVYLMVREKTREIGILRAMGMKQSGILAVFTLYGLSIGGLGAAAGLLLGLFLSARLDRLVAWLSDLAGVPLLNPEIYRFETIPTRVELSAVVSVLGAAFAMSLVASLLPAWRAARLEPTRCLHTE